MGGGAAGAGARGNPSGRDVPEHAARRLEGLATRVVLGRDAGAQGERVDREAALPRV